MNLIIEVGAHPILASFNIVNGSSSSIRILPCMNRNESCNLAYILNQRLKYDSDLGIPGASGKGGFLESVVKIIKAHNGGKTFSKDFNAEEAFLSQGLTSLQMTQLAQILGEFNQERAWGGLGYFFPNCSAADLYSFQSLKQLAVKYPEHVRTIGFQGSASKSSTGSAQEAGSTIPPSSVEL